METDMTDKEKAKKVEQWIREREGEIIDSISHDPESKTLRVRYIGGMVTTVFINGYYESEEVKKMLETRKASESKTINANYVAMSHDSVETQQNDLCDERSTIIGELYKINDQTNGINEELVAILRALDSTYPIPEDNPLVDHSYVDFAKNIRIKLEQIKSTIYAIRYILGV